MDLAMVSWEQFLSFWLPKYKAKQFLLDREFFIVVKANSGWYGLLHA